MMSNLSLRRLGLACVLGLLVGCAKTVAVRLPEPLSRPSSLQDAAIREVASQTANESGGMRPALTLSTELMLAPPLVESVQAKAPIAPHVRPEEEIVNADIYLEQTPLASLIQAVFAEILEQPVSIDERVRQRRDLVTFRTPPKMTRAQVRDAVTLLLKSYGIAVVDTRGLIRVVPDSVDTGVLPEIRRGSALPESPNNIRPIFQLVPLKAVRNTDVAGWLKNMFKERVNIQEDPGRNAILLSGNSDNVGGALQMIALLDQPIMAGRKSQRIIPTFWAAEELAKRLNEILAAEGYSMPPQNYTPTSSGIRYPLLLLPIAAQNAILVFAQDDDHLAHVAAWVDKLDLPSERGGGKGMFTYTAQNLSAEDLAKVLGDLFDGAAAPAATAGKEGAAVAKTTLSSGRAVVDRTSNTLIFRSTPEDYSQLINLLRILDRPPKAALIEVTVAELSLSDDNQFGIEWLLKDIGISGAGVSGGTLGGLSIGNAGFTLRRLASGGDTRLILNALASSNRANILSSPRVVARNGELATIQVGQEVPVITSQQSTISSATPNATGVLQTVQYRNTGVILKVKPVIHSGDRVDLEVQQEVSAAQSTVTGVNNSPTISTRKIDTKMTLQSGHTVLLGGLISGNDSGGEAGIPYLKDVPLLGGLFGVQSNKKNKTELVVLITPYVMNDENDARAITESFKSMLPWLGSASTTVPAGMDRKEARQ